MAAQCVFKLRQVKQTCLGQVVVVDGLKRNISLTFVITSFPSLWCLKPNSERSRTGQDYHDGLLNFIQSTRKKKGKDMQIYMWIYIRTAKTIYCWDLSHKEHNKIRPVTKDDVVALWLLTISVSDFHPNSFHKKTFQGLSYLTFCDNCHGTHTTSLLCCPSSLRLISRSSTHTTLI